MRRLVSTFQEPVQSLFQKPPPIQGQLAEHTPSKVTQKTHTLVVMRHLLIPIGIVLAITPFYMSMIFYTQFVILPSGLSIVIASVWFSVHPHPTPSTFKPKLPPFRGIENRGGNDCWINAAMQLFFQISTLRPLIQPTGRFPFFFHGPLQPIRNACDAYHKGGAMNSHKLREWLDAEKVTDSSAKTTQDDPIPLILYLFQKSNYCLPPTSEKIIDYTNGTVTNEINSPPNDTPSLYFFDLTSQCSDCKSPTLQKGLNEFFDHTETLPSGTERRTTRFMNHPPKHFGVSLTSQAAEQGMVVKNPVDCPFEITLSSSQCGKETSYSCDGFIFHTGTNANSGHWATCIKKRESWWLASDATVIEISEGEAHERMKTASFLHYYTTMA